MERFSTLFSRERSWENLHLSPLVQVPCLKKAQTTDLGSVPLSTFCVCTGLKIMAISRWSANFFSFSSFRLSPSCRGWWPPACTCFCTCCMNFCCFVPFLFFRPNVLSCQSNKFWWICWRCTCCSMCSYRPVCRGLLLLHWGYVCAQSWWDRHLLEFGVFTSMTFSFFFCSVFLLGPGAFFGGIFVQQQI